MMRFDKLGMQRLMNLQESILYFPPGTATIDRPILVYYPSQTDLMTLFEGIKDNITEYFELNTMENNDSADETEVNVKKYSYIGSILPFDEYDKDLMNDINNKEDIVIALGNDVAILFNKANSIICISSANDIMVNGKSIYGIMQHRDFRRFIRKNKYHV